MTLKTKVVNTIILLSVAIYSYKLVLFYLACGLYDVCRNRPLNLKLIKKYFLGLGIPTFIMSPINTFLDLLCLPFLNKKIYQISDLPKKYQQEIKEIISVSHNQKLLDSLKEKMTQKERGMVFYQWYGYELNHCLEEPKFNKKYKYIKTIGISVFNNKVVTNRHFGPVRASLRVLYNINDIKSQQSYINVMGVNYRWCDNKLFIFDDTLIHQSVNQTDEIRYCLFIDILRPSMFSWLLNAFVYAYVFLFKKISHIFYKAWSPLI